MRHRVARVGIILALAVAALALARISGQATVASDAVIELQLKAQLEPQLEPHVGPVASGKMSDPDTFSDAQLLRALTDEIDDAFDADEADKEVDLDDLAERILAALSDDGDSDYETEIDFEDFEAEMEEAETTLRRVIAQALDAADEVAALNNASLYRHAALELHAAQPGKNQKTTNKVGVQYAVRGLFRTSRAAGRPGGSQGINGA